MNGAESLENLFLYYSFGMGIFITFVYDWFRILRRVIRHNIFFVSLEDFLFWVFCALAVFTLMYRLGNGHLRWFAVMGALVGMGLYLKLVSPWFVRSMSRILNLLMAPFGRCGRYLKNKLTALCKLLKMKLCKQQ